MRHAFIGLCIFTAACSGQTSSPTSPSDGAGVAAAQTQASGGAPVEVTFTKWGTASCSDAYGALTGGDVPGTFAGSVLSRDAVRERARSFSSRPGTRSLPPIRRIRSLRTSKGR